LHSVSELQASDWRRGVMAIRTLRGTTKVLLPDPCLYTVEIISMSDIQLYLLEFDKDRKEASSIAAQSAKRTYYSNVHDETLMEPQGSRVRS